MAICTTLLTIQMVQDSSMIMMTGPGWTYHILKENGTRNFLKKKKKRLVYFKDNQLHLVYQQLEQLDR